MVGKEFRDVIELEFQKNILKVLALVQNKSTPIVADRKHSSKY